MRAPDPVRGLLLRTVFVAAALIATAAVLQRDLIEALLPWLRHWTEVFDVTYRTLSFELRPGTEYLLQRSVTLAELTVVGSQVLMPDPRGVGIVSTPAGHALQPIALALLVALAWPQRHGFELPARLVVVAPLLAVVVAVDLPVVMAALPWEVYVAAFEPDRFSPLLLWKDLMQGGGRLALGLAAGIVAVVRVERVCWPQR